MTVNGLRNIDLNLLVALEALLRTCNVTQAARELGMSQSAVSHALQRLRRMLNDPLLVRSRNEMVPTARGHALLAPTQEILRGLEHLVFPTALPTGPLRQIFRLLSTDYPQLHMLLPLAKRLAAETPPIALELQFLTAVIPDRELDHGRVDVCVAHMPVDLPSRLRRQPLFHDRLVVIARRGHPALEGGLTLELYQQLGQVGFLSRGSEMFQTLLKAEEPAVHRERRISVANMGLVPVVVTSSNYIATISQRSALLFQRSHPLDVFECPFAVRLFQVEMVWHQRDDGDAANTWLRQTLAAIGAEIDARPLEPVVRPAATAGAAAPLPAGVTRG